MDVGGELVIVGDGWGWGIGGVNSGYIELGGGNTGAWDSTQSANLRHTLGLALAGTRTPRIADNEKRLPSDWLIILRILLPCENLSAETVVAQASFCWLRVSENQDIEPEQSRHRKNGLLQPTWIFLEM